MKNFKHIILFLFVLITGSCLAQNAGGEVAMADKLYADGKIYVVIGVISIIFIGIAIYLFTIERKIKKLEEAIKEKQ